jgi:nucleoside-diphosphate-sugar epimerase
MTQKTLLSLGHGYSAEAFARLLIPRGWTILGTTRSPERAEALRALGVTPLILGRDDLPVAVARATHILCCAGPSQQGDPFLPALAPAIAAAAPTWIGYLSTTGIYGDHDGAWVTEDTPPNPEPGRATWRLDAERQWQDLGAHVFRLAGIYGPGRGPFAKIRAGTARRIVKPGQVFGRIHVDDIALTLAASLAQPHPGRIYNVCDDLPAPPQDVLGFAAGLLGLPLPPAEDFATADMSPMARSFYMGNRRVSNDRLRTELGVDLRYPDYRSGLRALLAAGE